MQKLIVLSVAIGAQLVQAYMFYVVNHSDSFYNIGYLQHAGLFVICLLPVFFAVYGWTVYQWDCNDLVNAIEKLETQERLANLLK